MPATATTIIAVSSIDNNACVMQSQRVRQQGDNRKEMEVEEGKWKCSNSMQWNKVNERKEGGKWCLPCKGSCSSFPGPSKSFGYSKLGYSYMQTIHYTLFYQSHFIHILFSCVPYKPLPPD